MATRNLTKRFVDLRNAAKANRHLHADVHDESSDSGLLNQGHETTNWKAMRQGQLPPRWVEDIDRTEETISDIQNKIRELSALHTKRLMVNFEADEAQQEHDIDMKTREITNLFRQAEDLLKKFSKVDKTAEIPDSEMVVRTNIQRSIAKRLQGLSMSFRTTQKEYLSRLKSQKAEGGGMFDFESKPSAGPLPMEIDTGFNKSQQQIVDDTEELVNQRDQEIAHIAKSIEELAQIFKELAVLVIDQGTILDRIDFNMEQAVEHAKEGITQIEKAQEHQKNSLPFKCIILLVVLIAVMLVALIVKHTSSKK